MLFLLLMFSFAQVGFLGIGSSVGSQAFLEHEVITLHRWLTPSQMADLMVFCRALPGGTGINTATLTGFLAASARFGFWGSVVASVLSVVSLALPSVLWTAFITRFRQHKVYGSWFDCALVVLRPLVPGLIAAAALLMMRRDIFSSQQINAWDFWVSTFLFLVTLVGAGLYRFNAVFMILLCGFAGWILL